MEYLQALIDNIPIVKWSDILDIIIVAFLFYKLLPILKSTGTVRVAAMIAGLLVVTWLTDALELNALNYILTELMAVGLLAIVILFQPEIRRMIDHMSNIKLREFLNTKKPEQEMVPIISHTVRACEVMSKERVGALIVFARNNRLDEHMKSGTMIEGQVSEQLIRNVFFPKAALHDGAMIIRDGRVTAAGCVLPLSDSNRISADLGTRHRAALGISEASDAVVVVVSEETGAISVAIGGMLKRYLAPETLDKLLRNELCPEQEQTQENLAVKLRQRLQKKDKEGNDGEK
ncbi:MAG: diadenylate cyclase CdaA [Oscillospiraceae bacterium]|nr:diadenylate cyclase CdaA [Oscillospiraceae bacterium]